MPKSLTHAIIQIVTVCTIIVTLSAQGETFAEKLVTAAHARTKANVRYDPSYVSIPYPNGDVPADTGVCTDVVIRSYRELGFDLQALVHEDMKANFAAYPSKRIWGLTKTDPNIDHRRVQNLRVFFSRHGNSLEVSESPEDYQAGDLVSWQLPGNLPHIGIVIDEKTPDGTPMVVHNVGQGPKKEDVLFKYEVTGHYRYQPK